MLRRAELCQLWSAVAGPWSAAACCRFGVGAAGVNRRFHHRTPPTPKRGKPPHSKAQIAYFLISWRAMTVRWISFCCASCTRPADRHGPRAGQGGVHLVKAGAHRASCRRCGVVLIPNASVAEIDHPREAWAVVGSGRRPLEQCGAAARRRTPISAGAPAEYVVQCRAQCGVLDDRFQLRRGGQPPIRMSRKACGVQLGDPIPHRRTGSGARIGLADADALIRMTRATRVQVARSAGCGFARSVTGTPVALRALCARSGRRCIGLAEHAAGGDAGGCRA